MFSKKNGWSQEVPFVPMESTILKRILGPQKDHWLSKGSLFPRRILCHKRIEDPHPLKRSSVSNGSMILDFQKDPRYSEGSLVFRRILGPQKDPLTPRDQGSPERSCVPKGSRIHRWILCPQGIKGSPVSKGWKILGMILNLKLPKKLLS